MLCRYPVVRGKLAFPCGQCLPCRLNRRRVWTHRLMLESLQHSDNAFVTLTYDDAHLPEGGTLVPGDMQAWLKRFRKAIDPVRIRYYGVGEYGEDTQRPHYHLAIFGYPGCNYGYTNYRKSGFRCCRVCDLVRSTWSLGNIFLGQLERQSMQYICGYVVKKMTGKSDIRLDGRHPEFSRMSLRPGIGFSALHEIASELMQYDVVSTDGDVPIGLRHGAYILPLGRYLRRKLRGMCGEEANAPAWVLEKITEELSAMYRDAQEMGESRETRELAFKEKIRAEGDQKVRQLEARGKLQKRRSTL